MNFYGTDANDFSDAAPFGAMYGGDGNDFLGLFSEGDGRLNYIDGGRGSDFLLFRDAGAHGEISGGQGSDMLVGNAGEDDLYGGRGNDALNSGRGNDELYGDGGTDALYGGDGDDKLHGGSGHDVNITFVPISHIPETRTTGGLYGGQGDDTLYGDDGNDFLDGGAGRDVMTGGDGADVFYFKSVAATDKDLIRDFRQEENDLIDLRDIDAMKREPGDQGFTFIGNKNFSGTKGELQFIEGKLKGDINGDGDADFTIRVDAGQLVESDFLL